MYFNLYYCMRRCSYYVSNIDKIVNIQVELVTYEIFSIYFQNFNKEIMTKACSEGEFEYLIYELINISSAIAKCHHQRVNL